MKNKLSKKEFNEMFSDDLTDEEYIKRMKEVLSNIQNYKEFFYDDDFNGLIAILDGELPSIKTNIGLLGEDFNLFNNVYLVEKLLPIIDFKRENSNSANLFLLGLDTQDNSIFKLIAKKIIDENIQITAWGGWEGVKVYSNLSRLMMVLDSEKLDFLREIKDDISLRDAIIYLNDFASSGNILPFYQIDKMNIHIKETYPTLDTANNNIERLISEMGDDIFLLKGDVYDKVQDEYYDRLRSSVSEVEKYLISKGLVVKELGTTSSRSMKV